MVHERSHLTTFLVQYLFLFLPTMNPTSPLPGLPGLECSAATAAAAAAAATWVRGHRPSWWGAAAAAAAAVPAIPAGFCSSGVLFFAVPGEGWVGLVVDMLVDLSADDWLAE